MKHLAAEIYYVRKVSYSCCWINTSYIHQCRASHSIIYGYCSPVFIVDFKCFYLICWSWLSIAFIGAVHVNYIYIYLLNRQTYYADICALNIDNRSKLNLTFLCISLSTTGSACFTMYNASFNTRSIKIRACTRFMNFDF